MKAFKRYFLEKSQTGKKVATFDRLKYYKRYFEQLAPKGVKVTTDKKNIVIKL